MIYGSTQVAAGGRSVEAKTRPRRAANCIEVFHRLARHPFHCDVPDRDGRQAAPDRVAGRRVGRGTLF
jgi:hypothetical protein